MKKQKVLPVIIDVTREKLSLCSSSNFDPVIFNFNESMMTDLEVINREELKSKLQAFVVEKKIKPSPLLMVLEDSVYFEKNYTGPTAPSMEEVQKFIDTVPFSAVSSKLFKVGNGYKMVVINRELYEALDQIFEKLGFPLMSVVPGFILSTVNAPPKFSSESCRVIYKKMDEILANSFSGVANEGSFANKKEVWLEKNKIMVIVLSFLMIGVCITVAFLTLTKKPTSKAKKVVTAVVVPTVVKAMPSPTPEAATISAEMVEKLTAQVLNGSGVVGMAASWEAKLKEWGFVGVKTGNAVQTTGVVVTFSNNVPEVVKSLMTEELKKTGNAVTATDSSAINFDVVLVIGK